MLCVCQMFTDTVNYEDTFSDKAPHAFLHILGCTIWLCVTLKIMLKVSMIIEVLQTHGISNTFLCHEFNEIFCKSHASQSFFVSMLLQ